MINWSIVMQKLTSRKFWSFIASFVSSLLVVLNFGENEIVQVTGLITMFGSMVIYVFAEALVDKERAKQEKTTQ